MEQTAGTKHHILVVEDDTALAAGLCRALQSEKAEIVSCNTLQKARTLLQDGGNVAFSLVLLDINLPDGSGFDFLQEIKEKYDTVVIMLTANDMETDIVAGLELGADDYITKPFSLAVLRARVEAQLRRVKTSRKQTQADQKPEDAAWQSRAVEMDDYRFDFAKMQFMHGAEQIELSKTEQKLFRLFVENRGITLTREQMITYIWSADAEFVDENALSVTVKRLRDKLKMQDRIKTVYGIGYRLE